MGEPRWHRAGSTGGWRYAWGLRVSLWPSPLQGSFLLSLSPNPSHRVFLHRCIMGWGPIARNGGLSTARPGLGLGGNQGETAARPGQGREPAATVLTAPGRWHLPAASSVGIHMNSGEDPQTAGESVDRDGGDGPPCFSRRDVPRPMCFEMRGGPPSSYRGGAPAPPCAWDIQRSPRSTAAVRGGRYLRWPHGGDIAL